MSNNSENTSKRVQIEHALKNKPKTLIIGYGNPDREDDGVAWHILRGVADNFFIDIADPIEEELIQNNETLHFFFSLQLLPEITSELVAYTRICFVDAHTGALVNDLNIQKLEAKFQNSPLTHHMTPQTILSILATAFNKYPASILVSVRGYQFGFENNLSPKTNALAQEAIDLITKWILNA